MEGSFHTGAGPTGVELAGAIKEIAGLTLPRDYRHTDTPSTRVILMAIWKGSGSRCGCTPG